jgi:predicted small secreted protein
MFESSGHVVCPGVTNSTDILTSTSVVGCNPVAAYGKEVQDKQSTLEGAVLLSTTQYTLS